VTAQTNPWVHVENPSISLNFRQPVRGEGAKFWPGVLTALKNRGVGDACMVVCDGPKGLPEAIGQTWPEVVEQACVIHLLRASFRYAGR
jgi:putative transposase